MKSLEERAKRFRERQQVRAWEYRQLAGTKGVWYRLRRMLARAQRAYAVDDATMNDLIALGLRLEPVGGELAPSRRYVFVGDEGVLDGRCTPLEVRLDAAMLASPNVVFVAFDESERAAGTGRVPR